MNIRWHKRAAAQLFQVEEYVIGSLRIWYVNLEIRREINCILTFCKLKHHFRLLLEFWPTRENRLKLLRWHFSTLGARNALKSNLR